MKPKVSVIVPVYNASRTLTACLGNLVHQTLPEIEIILVDDASTDDSLAFLTACEREFSDKIILIPLQENLGPGGARNVGLAYASGEYIGFVDSDDLADPGMYESLYHLAVSGNYDMVDCTYYCEESDSLILTTGDSCTGDLDSHKRSHLISGGGYLWSRLFRRELFDGLVFREHTILEDMEMLMQLFMRTKRLGTTRDVLYKYCATPSSASKPSNPVRYHKAIVGAMDAVYSTMSAFPEYPEIQTAVEYSLLHLYQCGVVNALQPDSVLSEPEQENFLDILYVLKQSMIQLPYSENPYVQDKISKEDLMLIQTLDKKKNR
ncbi:MAG: glycosyltransferase [Agathobacter sp.]|nr:glycosyltransferase [Agathobacter sp.]